MKEVPISVGTVTPLTERQIAEIPIDEAKKKLKYRGLLVMTKHLGLELGFGGIGMVGILFSRPEVVAIGASCLIFNAAHAIYKGNKLWQEGKELERQSEELNARSRAEIKLGMKPRIAKIQYPSRGRIFTAE